jgi:hypothetical protein
MPILRLEPIMQLGNTPKTSEKELSPGINGNIETLQTMIKVARQRSRHPLVRELALRILEHYRVPSQDYLKEAYAIGDYIKKKVRYVRDINGVETLHDPVTMIDQMKRGQAQGDCDDMALLIATLLLTIGHQPYFRVVRYYDGHGPYQHIYVVVYEQNWRSDKKRLVLDAILKRSKIGKEVPHKSGKEYKV